MWPYKVKSILLHLVLLERSREASSQARPGTRHIKDKWGEEERVCVFSWWSSSSSWWLCQWRAKGEYERLLPCLSDLLDTWDVPLLYFTRTSALANFIQCNSLWLAGATGEEWWRWFFEGLHYTIFQSRSSSSSVLWYGLDRAVPCECRSFVCVCKSPGFQDLLRRLPTKILASIAVHCRRLCIKNMWELVNCWTCAGNIN